MEEKKIGKTELKARLLLGELLDHKEKVRMDRYYGESLDGSLSERIGDMFRRAEELAMWKK